MARDKKECIFLFQVIYEDGRTTFGHVVNGSLHGYAYTIDAKGHLRFAGFFDRGRQCQDHGHYTQNEPKFQTFLLHDGSGRSSVLINYSNKAHVFGIDGRFSRDGILEGSSGREVAVSKLWFEQEGLIMRLEVEAGTTPVKEYEFIPGQPEEVNYS